MKNPCKNCKNSFTYKSIKRSKSYPSKSECIDCSEYKDYKQYLESRRIYTKGDIIRSIDEFDRQIENGCVYFADKVQNPGWLLGMQYRTIKNAIDLGIVRIAIKK